MALEQSILSDQVSSRGSWGYVSRSPRRLSILHGRILHECQHALLPGSCSTEHLPVRASAKSVTAYNRRSRAPSAPPTLPGITCWAIAQPPLAPSSQVGRAWAALAYWYGHLKSHANGDCCAPGMHCCARHRDMHLPVHAPCLLAGLLTVVLSQQYGLGALDIYRIVFAEYGFLAVAGALLVGCLSRAVEAPAYLAAQAQAKQKKQRAQARGSGAGGSSKLRSIVEENGDTVAAEEGVGSGLMQPLLGRLSATAGRADAQGAQAASALQAQGAQVQQQEQQQRPKSGFFGLSRHSQVCVVWEGRGWGRERLEKG